MTKVFKLAIAVPAVLAVTLPAYAVPTLRLTSGASFTIADQSALDFNPAVGVVTFIGTVGVFNINVSTGLTKPASGSAVTPYMDLNSINSSTAGGTISIEWTEDSFGPPAGSGTFVGAIGGTTAGTVSYNAYLDAGNTLFAPTTLIASLGPFGGPAFSGVGGTGAALPAGQYSLTQIVNITHGGPGTTSFDAELELPDSGLTMVMLGSSLAAMGLFVRSRKQ